MMHEPSRANLNCRVSRAGSHMNVITNCTRSLRKWQAVRKKKLWGIYNK